MSFSLELTNVFADDSVNFLNSQTKAQDLICHGEGTLTYTYLADTTFDSEIYDNVMNSTISSSVGYDQISYTDGINTHTITTYGKYEAPIIDTAGDCMVIVTVTKRLMGNGTLDACSIAVS